VQETALQLKVEGLESTSDQTLRNSIEKACKLFVEVEEISNDDFASNIQGRSSESMKILWKKWLKKHTSLEDLSKRLHAVKVDITTALTIMTA